MIKVLKIGHGDFEEIFCNYCGSELAYQKWDTNYRILGDWYYTYLDCPVCHKRVFLNRIARNELFEK